MKIPDLEYLIDQEEQDADKKARLAEYYYYNVELIRVTKQDTQFVNRRELLKMEKDARAREELKKLKKRMVYESSGL